MNIYKQRIQNLSLSNEVVISVDGEKTYYSGDGVEVNNTENKISANYAEIAAKLNVLPDPFPLSSQVSSMVTYEEARAKDAENGLSVAIDSKIYIDGISAESLSAIHIDAEDYYQKVIDGTVKPNELYILSCKDYINCFDKRVANVSDAKESHDAVSKGFMETYVSSKYENIYNYVVEQILTSNDENLKTRFKTWLGL